MVITRNLLDTASASTASDIQLGSCVTEIGERAFSGYTNISEIELPDSVTTIGTYAFNYCQNLTAVTIPDSVTTIGNYAFERCYDIRNLSIGSGVTSIGDGAFGRCTSLTSITIPDSVTTIGSNGNYGAFYDCSGATSLTIGSGVTSIASSAFRECTSLTAITINATTPPTLGSSVFSNTNNCLIYVPSESYYNYMSAWSQYADRIYYDGVGAKAIFASGSTINTVKCTDDGILTRNEVNTYGISSTATTCTFGECLTSIGNGAMSGNTFGDIIFSTPTSNITIGTSAFENDYIYNGIEFAEGITEIGENAFKGVNRKQSYITTPVVPFHLPKTLQTIGTNAFSGAVISDLTIYGNSGLNLTSGTCQYATITGDLAIHNVETIGGRFTALLNGKNMTSIRIDTSGTTTIGVSAFTACSSATSISIGNGVTSIGACAFSGCTSASAITLPNTISSIEDKTFNNCRSLISIDIPSSVTSIGASAFESCSALTYANIPNGVTSIGNGVFKNCTGLTSVNIPTGISSIPQEMFRECRSISSITIPSNISSIGVSGFSECRSITSVTVPSSVLSIGNYAFRNCSGLTSITMESSTPPTIGTYVFNGSSCPIYVPSASYDLYVNAENWSAYADRIVRSGSIIKAYVVTSQNSGYTIDCNESSELSASDFDELNYVKNLTIGECTTSIADNLFSGRTVLRSVSFPDTIRSIGSNAFKGTNLSSTTLNFSSNLQTIGEGAFQGTSLVSVRIPVSVTSIGASGFCGGNSSISSVSSLTLNCNSAQIGDYAFANTYIENVTIPSGNTYGASVFEGSKRLTNAVIEEGNTAIPNRMFSGSTVLSSITIPNSITSIGDYAFALCNINGDLVLPSGVTSIGYGAFFYATSLNSIRFTSPVPPALGAVERYDIMFYSGTTLYVPCSYYDTYVQAWTDPSAISHPELYVGNHLTPYGEYFKQEVIENEYICENGDKYEKVGRYVSSDNINWCLIDYIKGNLIESSSTYCLE